MSVRSGLVVLICALVSLLVAYAAVGVWIRADLDYKIAQSRLGPKVDDQEVIYDGVPFKSKDALLLFLTDQNAKEYFPWAFKLPELSVLVLGAFCFGFLGAAVRCLKSAAIDKQTVPHTYVPLGGAVGVVVLMLAYTMPAVLLGTSKVPLYPPTMLCLALLGGLFAGEVYGIIQSRLRTVFGVK